MSSIAETVIEWNEWQDPTAADLAAIEGEWESIAADLAVVDAQIEALKGSGFGVDDLAIRRARRAARRVLHAVGGEAA